MRGEEKRQVRLRNLRALCEQHSLVKIARRSGTSEKYLSQILNEVVQQRGKTPRSLSDNYAAKIEAGMGLDPGWLDQPHGSQPNDAIENTSPGPDIGAQRTEPLTALLDRVADQLNQADPSVRDEVTRLIMRYIENPETGARIAKAIELLLSKDAPDDPAAR